MKRHHNTIQHCQRRWLGTQAYLVCLAQITTAQAIITAVCKQTPEQRAAIRAEFDKLYPNFFTARS